MTGWHPTEHEHDLDRMLDIVDPAKDLVPKLGILGLGIDGEMSKMFAELREALESLSLPARRPRGQAPACSLAM
jgi:hypothetical protein